MQLTRRSYESNSAFRVCGGISENRSQIRPEPLNVKNKQPAIDEHSVAHLLAPPKTTTLSIRASLFDWRENRVLSYPPTPSGQELFVAVALDATAIAALSVVSGSPVVAPVAEGGLASVAVGVEGSVAAMDVSGLKSTKIGLLMHLKYVSLKRLVLNLHAPAPPFGPRMAWHARLLKLPREQSIKLGPVIGSAAPMLTAVVMHASIRSSFVAMVGMVCKRKIRSKPNGKVQ
jgi:hypothetical protein